MSLSLLLILINECMDVHVLLDWMASLAFLPSSTLQAGRASRKEKINAWHLNECGEWWIDRDSKLGQQDCLFKGQDPLIIVLAEIDSQACTVPSLTPRYLHCNTMKFTKHTHTHKHTPTHTYTHTHTHSLTQTHTPT